MINTEKAKELISKLSADIDNDYEYVYKLCIYVW